jgi:hypothetical protein
MKMENSQAPQAKAPSGIKFEISQELLLEVATYLGEQPLKSALNLFLALNQLKRIGVEDKPVTQPAPLVSVPN